MAFPSLVTGAKVAGFFCILAAGDVGQIISWFPKSLLNDHGESAGLDNPHFGSQKEPREGGHQKERKWNKQPNPGKTGKKNPPYYCQTLVNSPRQLVPAHENSLENQHARVEAENEVDGGRTIERRGTRNASVTEATQIKVHSDLGNVQRPNGIVEETSKAVLGDNILLETTRSIGKQENQLDLPPNSKRPPAPPQSHKTRSLEGPKERDRAPWRKERDRVPCGTEEPVVEGRGTVLLGGKRGILWSHTVVSHSVNKMSLTDDQLRTALSLTALVKPFEDNRANGRATKPADFENLLRQATPLVDRLRFEANQRVPNWVMGAIFVLHLVIMNIKSEYTRAKINASDTPDWFLSKDNLRALSKHHAWFNRDLPPEPPRDPLDLLDDFFDTPAPKPTKPAAKAGAIPGITPRKPSAFTIPDAPSAATSRKISTKSTPQVMMPPPITVKKPLPPAKTSTKRSREVQALEREAQEASMSERLEDSPDETPVTKKAKQQVPKPSNTRQLRPKNRPVSPLKPASTSKSRQKQKATSLDSFIDDATQEESEEEEEDEGERTADTQIEEGEATEPEAEATDAEAERPPSPVQQKEKTVKRTRHRTRTSKTRQTPALDRPDTNKEDPDVQDGTNEEALTAPVGVPTRIIRSKLPRHAMLRDPNFSAHTGSGYIFVNRTGSMLNVEDLLETNHSFSGTVDRSVCSTCATDTHYRSCVYQGPGKQCNRCHTAGRHCSFEMSLDRLEIFSQGVNHIVQQSSPSINHQIQRVLAVNELTATASNTYLRLNRYREEEIAQLQRQLTDVPRLLWQIELSNPDFELDDDKLRELSIACGWSFVPSEGDARQIFESLQQLGDDQQSSFNQPFSAASLWLERLAASRSGRVPSPDYTFTLTTDLDLDQQPVASSSRVRLPTPTPRSPPGPTTVEDLLSEHEASFQQAPTIVENLTSTDESYEDLPADVEEQGSA
ncbi:hypothetical protein K435DRAFT_794920 [Dendrothele bispora CBS 962.96]|uniref:Uncharacterized protein n=1 Tax=Dendrothele bispora (strain CBS 962.96) TaxID=1314807 RepID=A0A4S8MB70_DENBC|nr:hypothetical protein K435DRAFT_794920 [Dendrothele bispora CBS 962.96]